MIYKIEKLTNGNTLFWDNNNPVQGFNADSMAVPAKLNPAGLVTVYSKGYEDKTVTVQANTQIEYVTAAGSAFLTLSVPQIIEKLYTDFFFVADKAGTGILTYCQVQQNSFNWTGNGQNIRQGASWVYWDFIGADSLGMSDQTIYDTGTATGTQTATRLQDNTKVWNVNQYAGYFVKITGGTNIGEVAKILSNTADTLTIDAAWITTIDNSSSYEISRKPILTIKESGRYLINNRLTFNNSPGRILGVQLFSTPTFLNSAYAEGLNIESTVFLPSELPTFAFSVGDEITVKAYNGGAGAHRLLSFGARNRITLTKLGDS